MGESVVESLDDYIAEMDDSDGWPTLFSKLLQQAMKSQSPCLVAKEPESKTRNRYRDVLPADISRVELMKVEPGESDYINANFVKVNEVSRRYILTQGPLPHTAEHFWQMVWEQNSKGIAMLNRVIEKGMRKCHQYFPCRDVTGTDTSPLTSVSFGPYRISLVDREDKGGFVMNKLCVEHTGSDEPSREVLHFHYRKWPDFHLPDTAEDFLDYLWALRDSGCLSNDVGPLVVHCSAGIGRSGTLILVDVCLKEIELRGDLQGSVIEEYLQSMRRQRFGLIQTPEQLRFAYLAIAEGIDRVEVPAKKADKQNGEGEEAAASAAEAPEEEKEEASKQPAAAAAAVAAATVETTAEAVAEKKDDEDNVGQPPCKRPAEEDPSVAGDQPPAKIPYTGDSLNSTGQVTGGGSENGNDKDREPGLTEPASPLSPATEGIRARGAHNADLAAKVDDMKKKQEADKNQKSSCACTYSTYIKVSIAAVVLAGGAYLAYRRFM